MADAPPHGIDQGGDTYPDGDPDGKDPLVIAREMAGLGIALYSILVSSVSSTVTKDFFAVVSSLTGGQCLSLQDASLLPGQILSGVKENIDLETKMAVVSNRLQELTKAKGSTLTREEVETVSQSVTQSSEESAATRAIATEKLISTTDAKFDVAKRAANLAELKLAWHGSSLASSTLSHTAAAPEAISSRISRMVVAREARSTDPVVVECVRDGSKVRARVISDGYDQEKNLQFPKDIREVGKRFLVDQVVDAGTFYRVKGNITPMV